MNVNISTSLLHPARIKKYPPEVCPSACCKLLRPPPTHPSPPTEPSLRRRGRKNSFLSKMVCGPRQLSHGIEYGPWAYQSISLALVAIARALAPAQETPPPTTPHSARSSSSRSVSVIDNSTVTGRV